MSTYVPRVQNADAEIYSLFNVRFSPRLAALTSTKIRFNLTNSNLADFQRVFCAYYTKREDILSRVPVSNTAHPQLLSDVQITCHFLWTVKKILQSFPHILPTALYSSV